MNQLNSANRSRYARKYLRLFISEWNGSLSSIPCYNARSVPLKSAVYPIHIDVGPFEHFLSLNSTDWKDSIKKKVLKFGKGDYGIPRMDKQEETETHNSQFWRGGKNYNSQLVASRTLFVTQALKSDRCSSDNENIQTTLFCFSKWKNSI